MTEVLALPVAFEPSDTASAELVVVVPSDAWLTAHMLGRAERKRRSATGRFASSRLYRYAANPFMNVVAAAAVVAVLAVNRAVPGLVWPDWVWLLTWAPMVVLTLTWRAALPACEQANAAAAEKATNPKLRRGALPTEVQVRILPDKVEAAGAGQQWSVLRSPWHTAVETPDAFVVVLDQQVIPLPKAGMGAGNVVSLRAALRHWQLRPAPPRLTYVMPLLVGILCLVSFALIPRQAAPNGGLGAAARTRPGRATIHLTNRYMRLDGARTSIEDETYAVWLADGEMSDRLGGTVKHLVGDGWFWLNRHPPGNTVRMPEAELKYLQGSDAGKDAVPDDAVASALPGHGVLITWPDKLADGTCGAVRSYRDQVPPDALPAGTPPVYRRNLLLRFCAPGMVPAALGDWLVAAVPAFHAEFNSAVRP